MMLERDKVIFEQKAQSMMEKQASGIYASNAENLSLLHAYGAYYSNLQVLFEKFPNAQDTIIVQESMDTATDLMRKLSEDYFSALERVQGEKGSEPTKLNDALNSQQPHLNKMGAEIESIKEQLPETNDINDLEAIKKTLGDCLRELDDLLSNAQQPGDLLIKLFNDVNDLLVQARDREKILMIISDIKNLASQDTIVDRGANINAPEALQMLKEYLLYKKQKIEAFDPDIDSDERKIEIKSKNDLLDSAIIAVDKQLSHKASDKAEMLQVPEVAQHRAHKM